ncbi:MAG: crotonase/enoyl-CoA hydratase family protein [Chromatiales bacterium]
MSDSNVTYVTRREYEHLDMRSEPGERAVWVRMRNAARPCMSTALLEDLAQAQKEIGDAALQAQEVDAPDRVAYQVLASSRPGVFSLGGDLEHFLTLMEGGDRAGLFQYGKRCVDVLYMSATAYGLPFTTISLVQGQALGGGFEAALSNTVVVAEESATFGFPETLFGLFPGMGALSLLCRRVAPGLAKRIITSGRLYSARELYDLGVVDVLARDGEGEQAVHDYISGRRSRETGFYALDRAAFRITPVSYDELIEVVRIWVDTAMTLSGRNRRLMRYLLEAQRRRWEEASGVEDRVEEQAAV